MLEPSGTGIQKAARLVALIQEAAVRPVKRIATKPTKASRQKRLEGKKVRSAIKGMRRAKPSFD